MLPAWIGAGSGLETHFVSATDRRATGLQRKLVIVLHGRGDDLSSFFDLPFELPLAQTDYLLLNAPYPMREGRKWMLLDEPRHLPSLELTRTRLLKLVAELQAWGYDPEQIFWLGHSQGGRVALDLVLNSPFRYAGLIGVSSYMGWMLAQRHGQSLSNRRPTITDLTSTFAARVRSTPMLFTHGRRDRVITPREIRGDVRWARTLGFAVTYAEFEKGHEFEDPREMRFIQAWMHARSRSNFIDLNVGRSIQLEAPSARTKGGVITHLHRPSQPET